MRTLFLLAILYTFNFPLTTPDNTTNTYTSFSQNTTTSISTTNPLAEDTERPFAVCVEEIHIDLKAITGTTVLTATELEAGLSKDNQTNYKHLIFSFSRNIDNQRLIFDCNKLGRNVIELWVTDEAGNQDYCTAVVYVKDSNKVCGMSHKASTLANLKRTNTSKKYTFSPL